MGVPKSAWPLTFAGLTTLACSDDAVEPSRVDRILAIRNLAIVSGDNQEGKAGEQLPESLVVQVTDYYGNPVERVKVSWRVTSGAGLIQGSAENTVSTQTDRDGLSGVMFYPTVLATSTVAAAVEEKWGQAVRFTTMSTVLVVHNGYWGWFFAPDGFADVAIPVGTPVEWLNYFETDVHVWSISEPNGGPSFDTGNLTKGERFRFVPNTSGTWEWTWEYLYDDSTSVSPTTRKLTARPAGEAARPVQSSNAAPAVVEVTGSWSWTRVEKLTMPPFVAEFIFGIEPEGPVTQVQCEGSGTMELFPDGAGFAGALTVQANHCVTGNGFGFTPPGMASPPSLLIGDGTVHGRSIQFLMSAGPLGCPFNGVITDAVGNTALGLKATGRCIVPGHPQSPLDLNPPPLGTSKTVSWEAVRQ